MTTSDDRAAAILAAAETYAQAVRSATHAYHEGGDTRREEAHADAARAQLATTIDTALTDEWQRGRDDGEGACHEAGHGYM